MSIGVIGRVLYEEDEFETVLSGENGVVDKEADSEGGTVLKGGA